MNIPNDFIYMDIFAIKPEIREKLHLRDEDLQLTDEDIELLNTSSSVNMDKLAEMVNKAGFKNFEIPNEIGISKAMYSMVFNENTKNHRGLRMRTVVAILNAIRCRNIRDPFNEILVKGGKIVK